LFILAETIHLNRLHRITSLFIDSYEKPKEFPNDTFGWEAKIEGSVKYQSESVLNIEINHYTYTGGAHISRIAFFTFLTQVQENRFQM
jgi:hypothetical protein